MDERPEAWSPRVKTVRAGSLSMGSTSEEGEFQQGWEGDSPGELEVLPPLLLLETHHPHCQCSRQGARGGRCIPGQRPMILKSVAVVQSPCRWHAAQTAYWSACRPARAGGAPADWQTGRPLASHAP